MQTGPESHILEGVQLCIGPWSTAAATAAASVMWTMRVREQCARVRTSGAAPWAAPLCRVVMLVGCLHLRTFQAIIKSSRVLVWNLQTSERPSISYRIVSYRPIPHVVCFIHRDLHCASTAHSSFFPFPAPVSRAQRGHASVQRAICCPV